MEVRKYYVHQQEGQERTSRKGHSFQPELSAREGNGADHPECHHAACTA